MALYGQLMKVANKGEWLGTRGQRKLRRRLWHILPKNMQKQCGDNGESANCERGEVSTRIHRDCGQREHWIEAWMHSILYKTSVTVKFALGITPMEAEVEDAAFRNELRLTRNISGRDRLVTTTTDTRLP